MLWAESHAGLDTGFELVIGQICEIGLDRVKDSPRKIRHAA
jgi:hypothetical protein